VHDIAEEMEHHITPEMERELTALLQDPKADPHKQPIPRRPS
jgi:manganese/zinc/iron transport system permease protein